MNTVAVFLVKATKREMWERFCKAFCRTGLFLSWFIESNGSVMHLHQEPIWIVAVVKAGSWFLVLKSSRCYGR